MNRDLPLSVALSIIEAAATKLMILDAKVQATNHLTEVEHTDRFIQQEILKDYNKATPTAYEMAVLSATNKLNKGDY